MTLGESFEQSLAQVVQTLQHHESYFGLIETVGDAMAVIEGTRLGLLPRVRSRLDEREREAIRAGSVFVYVEDESKIRRWTDGKLWSPSRVSGDFLLYREERGAGSGDGEPVVDGLIKRTITFNSRNAAAGRRTASSSGAESFHLVAYSRETQRELLQVLSPTNTGVLPALIQQVQAQLSRMETIRTDLAPGQRPRRDMHDMTGHFRLESKRHLRPKPTAATSSAAVKDDEELFSHFLQSIHSSLPGTSNPDSGSGSGTASVHGPPPIMLGFSLHADDDRITSAGMQLRTGKRLGTDENPVIGNYRPKIFVGHAGTLVLLDNRAQHQRPPHADDDDAARFMHSCTVTE